MTTSMRAALLRSGLRLVAADGQALWPDAAYCPSCAASPCKCARCHGAGYYRSAAAASDHIAPAVQCDCRRAESAARSTGELERLSMLPSLASCTFGAFDGSAPGVADALARAQSFAECPRGWLVLAGGTGVGKTHLAAAVGHALAGRGQGVVMQVVADLLDHLKATFRPNAATDYDELFAAVRSAPVLILDDYGAEKSTDWAREKLFQIVDRRWREHAPLVVTTNALGQLEPRVRDRLTDDALSIVCPINAPSYRQRPVKFRKGGAS